MGGSGNSGSSDDERGTLIRFPRPEWIPADGIEPLNTQDREEGSTSEPANLDHGDGAERGATTATIEAGDFLASGDTQEFVGSRQLVAQDS